MHVIRALCVIYVFSMCYDGFRSKAAGLIGLGVSIVPGNVLYGLSVMLD